MSSRRETLRLLVLAPAARALSRGAQESKEVETQPGHLHTGSSLQVPVPSQPTFFQPAEFRTIESLSECIIPKSDTPGAKEAGVALLIDKALATNPALMPSYRDGIADLNALAVAGYGSVFAELDAERQVALVTRVSLDPESPLGRFFVTVKNMTVDAYYKTEVGLKQELGWHGNTFLAEFPGCPHPEHQS